MRYLQKQQSAKISSSVLRREREVMRLAYAERFSIYPTYSYRLFWLSAFKAVCLLTEIFSMLKYPYCYEVVTAPTNSHSVKTFFFKLKLGDLEDVQLYFWD